MRNEARIKGVSDMKIGVVTETSTAAKNKAIMDALATSCKTHTAHNIGMKGTAGENELLIYETGFLTALLLNLTCVDFVIGGCGTGQGYFNCAVQFPGVTCGLILDPTDAWVYPRINSGNCVSLALNKGYGWAGEINLQFIFEKLFSADFGAGYPAARKEPQKKIRDKLALVSAVTHTDFAHIISAIDEEIFQHTTQFPGALDFIEQHAEDKSGAAYHALFKRAKGKAQ
jgi:ribose 5-phosphate isomerase RpiB